MLICSFAFSILAAKYEKVNGVVDYVEATCGPRYGYYIGWFMATTAYYPSMTSVVIWVGARFTSALLGFSHPVSGGATFVIACLGTGNGLMLGCVRGMYALAVRDEGPRPDVFRQVTNMPTNSCVVGLLVCAASMAEIWRSPCGSASMALTAQSCPL